MNPEQWGDINILLFARGSLKTWTTTTIASWGLDMYPSLEGAATAPVDDQRGEVIDRFKQKVEQSGMVDRRVKNNEGHQKFKNTAKDHETGQTYPAYSHLKSRSAWNEGDKLRGIHAHFGIIDESQDVDEGTFSTFLEAIDRSVPQVEYFPTIFVIGTPKMANTFFHRLWRMSDQKTWDAEEGEHGEWIQQQDADEFLPQSLRARKEELNEKLDELDGRDTEEANRLRQEYQDELDEMEGFSVRGWHIDQYNNPLHDTNSIAFKKETYSKRKFENEVLANFYTPENDLITNDDVFMAFDDDLRERSSRMWGDSTVVLGVDWGGGKGEGAASTVCTIAEQHPETSELHIRHIDVFDSGLSSKEEREQIDAYMDAYDVDLGVVDEGYGDTDREELQDEYGWNEQNPTGAIYGCWYGNVKDKEEVKWNRFENQKRFFTTSKTFVVKKMAEDFKNGEFVLPKEGLAFDTKHSKGTQIVEQLTAPYTDRKETSTGRTKIEVCSDRNDDIFDSFCYAWIAANMLTSNRTVREIGSTDRPGM